MFRLYNSSTGIVSKADVIYALVLMRFQNIFLKIFHIVLHHLLSKVLINEFNILVM